MLGVVEGFFGPEWPWTDRHMFCAALRSYGGDHYIYAPKRDPYLRKDWTVDHPTDWWSELKRLREQCETSGIDFGVALSPFELHDHWTGPMRESLRRKVLRLEELGIRYLGLFFDDMKGAPDLAAKQAEIVEFTRSLTSSRIIFCPTYYSHDPILDKVFGARPEGYLERIGRDLHADVRICWTGAKVISPVMDGMEIKDVASVLRRKPLIWDNFYANDGPKMCKFLKLKPFTGRSAEVMAETSGWTLNLMNQPAFSELVFASAASVLKQSSNPEEALHSAMDVQLGAESSRRLQSFLGDLSERGLDGLTDSVRSNLSMALPVDSRPGQELRRWLAGEYLVGSECLTD